ncbi:LysM peptidoglycan-binding domain-containing protein [Paenibacillus polysaccharolyticus]|uniref:LysM peptidoglycan-binding domain-containing protein n=1 Tax=Paenibacillus polysaccharolyticus TaxID=582692 RepID=UPI002959549C|nr:nucleoid-associated protein YgaU [Paenibacillus intestini]
MSYSIQLSFNNRAEYIFFPVIPESIEFSDAGDGSTFNVSRLGEINVIKSPKLREVSFSGIFPADYSPYHYKYDVKDPKVKNEFYRDPYEYVKDIIRWMQTGRPVRLIFSSERYTVNMAVSIESFDWKETAGTVGDVQYDIKLKQYVFYAAKKVVSLKNSQNKADASKTKTKASRPDEKVKPKTVTLKAGDSLWSVAKAHLGDGARWKELQKLNGIKDAQLKKLPVGLVIKLP